MSAASTRGYALALGDDSLVMAQRLGEWIASAPQIEEDIALGNLALDQLGQARALLSYAGSLFDPARSEDDLAYLRDADSFRNVLLVERPWGAGTRDFGVAMARLLLVSTYQLLLYDDLRTSSDSTLAAIAAKAVKEVDYHNDHATRWVLRLGDGTEESHHRLQAAFDAEWPHLEELFDGSFVDSAALASGVAVDPASLRVPVLERVGAVLSEATLVLPAVSPALGRGRWGEHTEHLRELLADMQGLARAHPGVAW
ncbi:phenylacetate-CoA oxygenase subunit PaaC [soil metagenome]